MNNVLPVYHSVATRIAGVMKKFSFLEKESYAAAGFFLLNTWIHSNTLYLVLLGLYIPVLYLISKDVKKTLWIAMVSTIPFQQAKYAYDTFHSYTFTGVSVPVLYFISYTDILLFGVVAYILKTEYADNHIRITFPDLLIGLILILAGISTYYSGFFPVAFFGYYQLVKLLLMYISARFLLKNSAWVKLTIEICLLFVFYNSGLIILQTVRGGPLGIIAERLNQWSLYGRFADETQSLYRPGGISDDPNRSATVIGMFVPLLAIVSVTKNTMKKGLAWVMLITAVLALVYTGSRSVIAGTFIITGCAVYVARRRYGIRLPDTIKRKRVMLILIMLLLTGPFLITRFTSLLYAFSGWGGGIYRLNHFQIAFNTMVNRPVGTGLNTTSYEAALAYDPNFYMFDPSELHNIGAQIGAYLGFPGLILFILWFSMVITRLMRYIIYHRNTIMPFTVLLVLISYFVSSNFYPWFLSVPVSGFFWILAGNQYD